MRDFPTGNVDVLDMTRARDARAARQREMLAPGSALVCFTLNVPGPQKVSPLLYEAFMEGRRLIEDTLGAWDAFCETLEKTGFEAYYALKGDTDAIKRRLCALEDATPLGRLFDIDVLSANGKKVSREELGLKARGCFMCGQPAFACARSRAHSVAEMTAKISGDIRAFLRERTLSRMPEEAVNALISEADTTPKPGLVDRDNTGSHPDMSLALLHCSARALRPYFADCARIGFDETDINALFPLLNEAGAAAERDMLRLTGGVNTHKGAIFSLGILCAAAARRAACAQDDPAGICQTAGDIVRGAVEKHFSSLTAENARSFGEKLFLQTGLRGIRGEAAEGFPALINVWPDFSREAGELPTNEAGVRALIRLLAEVRDTTLIKRGGLDAQREIAAKARMIAADGFQTAAIRALDREMIARSLTCGGCADLLACLYFLLNVTALSERSLKNQT